MTETANQGSEVITFRDPKEMGLGGIVREIISNSITIRSLVGNGVGDANYLRDTPLRHEYEKRQEQLFEELDRKESLYLK